MAVLILLTLPVASAFGALHQAHVTAAPSQAAGASCSTARYPIMWNGVQSTASHSSSLRPTASSASLYGLSVTYEGLPSSLVDFLFGQNLLPSVVLYRQDKSEVPLSAVAASHTATSFTLTAQAAADALFAVAQPGGTALFAARLDQRNASGGTATLVSCTLALSVPYSAPPRAPADLLAVALSSTSVRLDWRPGGHEYGFAVFDAVSGKFVARPTSSRFTLTHLTPNSDYCAIVIAWNNVGWSGWSNWACFTTPDVPAVPPPAPTALTATPVDSTHVELDWSANGDGADGYTIDDDNTGVAVGTADPGSSSYVLSDLQPNTQYCAVVTAFNSAGSSGPSNEACATTPP